MIWIDTDMGFDDILAIMMIEASPLEVAGISLVFGNAPLDQVRRNAAGAAALLGWHFPVFTGARTSILGNADTPGHVLGPKGIPTRGQCLPECAPVPENPSLPALASWLEQLDGTGDILALGPLTNLAVLALSRPDLLGKIGTITWMGGGATLGNQTASAEFNAFADPEAVHIVLQSGVKLKIADLDLCRQVLLGPEDLTRLEKSPGHKAKVLADLCGAYIDIALKRGRAKMALYDPTAAAVVIAPDAFDFEPAHVAMELSGTHTRGRTIVDQRHGTVPNCQWGMKTDGPRVAALAMDTLEKAALS